MKASKLVIVAALMVALGTPVLAHQEVSAEAYDAAMKQLRGAVGAVRDQMSAEDASGLGASGELMVESLTAAGGYWTARNAEPAMELAAKALAAARQFQEAGAAGNFEAAGVAFGELRSTCTPCHEQYRERDADGNWQIKQ